MDRIQSMRRIEALRDRRFATSLPSSALESIQSGTLKTRYKGLRLCKNPFDLVLYLQLIQRLKPQTIIEVGTSEGGSAIWFDDLCTALGLGTRILSFDIAPPGLESTPTVQFFEADAGDPEGTFPTEMLKNAPHPWLVVDDSAHTYLTVSRLLRYFDNLVHPGDYVVVEDGIVADLEGLHYEAFDDGPNRAVADFLESRQARYRIDSSLCDFYGYNVTYCPNAWLEVCAAS